MFLGDNTLLDERQRRAVRERVEETGFACVNCGSRGFEVGDALYLGFLFLSEERDAYMVALTCANPRCGTPRTGIRLRGAEFLR